MSADRLNGLRVLFLDIDGVLNSSSYFRREVGEADGRCMAAYENTQLDPLAIERLNRVIDVTNAEVVISSAWRIGNRIGAIQRAMRDRGFRHRLYCKTPVLLGGEGLRNNEIQKWLDDNQPVERFAIVDDLFVAGIGFVPQFVLTDYEDGLTDVHADRLIQILNRPEEE